MPSSTTANAHPPAEDCEYSVPTWKRATSAWDVFFTVKLPYQKPENSLAAYLWRKRLWFETTFALSMMEPWEKLLLVLVLTTLLVLFLTGLVVYFPVHLSFILSRAKYYLSGTEMPSGDGSLSSVALGDRGSSLTALGDYSEAAYDYAYAGVAGGIEKLVATWRSLNVTSIAGAEL